MKKFTKSLICSLSMLIFSLSFSPVLANDSEQLNATVIYQSELTQSEIDQILIDQTEAYLKETIPGYDANSKGRARPSYETVYGPTKKVTAAGYAGNQVAGGYRFATGGGFYYSNAGGPSVTVGVGFGSPYGSFNVSFSLGNKVSSGRFVTVPNRTQYFKLYVSSVYNVRPFIVYYNDGNGHKSVYQRNVSSLLYSENAYAKAV